MHVVEELSARIGTLQQQLEAAKEVSITKQMRAFRTDEFERSLQRGGLSCIWGVDATLCLDG